MILLELELLQSVNYSRKNINVSRKKEISLVRNNYKFQEHQLGGLEIEVRNIRVEMADVKAAAASACRGGGGGKNTCFEQPVIILIIKLRKTTFFL